MGVEGRVIDAASSSLCGFGSEPDVGSGVTLGMWLIVCGA